MREEAAGEKNPRVCLVTGRNISCRAFQCSLYEAQDVFAEVDDVDMIHLQPKKNFESRWLWHKKLLFRDFTKKLAFVNPGLQPVRLTREYDLFIAVCQNFWDLIHVNAITGWKERCRTSVCWIDEAWAHDSERYKYWLPALGKFDHVILGLGGSVDAISRALGRPCHHVPTAVDAIRFSPFPQPPARGIDVYSLGRRWEGVHQALRNLAEHDNIFYVFDTFQGSDAQTMDHRHHREMLANMAKRSRYFMVGPGKFDVPEETRGQIEIGYRYYEGAAAGTVMIGQVPKCDAFQATFDWPDAVIEIRTDGSDVAEVLSGLAAQPERLRDISRRNSMQALLRHDWAYRWKKILGIAGLTPAPAFEVRERCLNRLAEQAKNDL